MTTIQKKRWKEAKAEQAEARALHETCGPPPSAQEKESLMNAIVANANLPEISMESEGHVFDNVNDEEKYNRTLYINLTTLDELRVLHRLMDETEEAQWLDLVIQDEAITITFKYDSESEDERLLHVAGLGYSS